MALEIQTGSASTNLKTTQRQLLLWIALALAVALGLLSQFYPLADARDRVRALPLNGLNYSGQDLEIPEAMRALFGKAKVLKRGYQVGGQRVILWVVDGTHNRHAVHDPLYCLRGDGWQIKGQQVFPVEGGEANLIRVEKNGRQAESLIWFSDGHQRHASAIRYWWQTTLRRLSLGRSGSEPVLITLQPVGGATVDWLQFTDQFSSLFNL